MRDVAASDAPGGTPAHLRTLTLVCWAIVAAVLLRIASGGGSITGFRYVLRTEPVVDLVAGAITLLAGAIAVAGLLGGRSWAWPVARFAATLALGASVLLALAGHDSAVVSGAAAFVARLVAVRAVRIGDARPA